MRRNSNPALPRLKWLAGRGGTAMNANAALTVALAVTVLVGGVAVAGAATPAGQAADTPDEANSSSAARGGNDVANDPRSETPTPVPDRVGGVHQKIDAYLEGDLDDLGSELRGLLSSDSADAEQ